MELLFDKALGMVQSHGFESEVGSPGLWVRFNHGNVRIRIENHLKNRRIDALFTNRGLTSFSMTLKKMSDVQILETRMLTEIARIQLS